MALTDKQWQDIRILHEKGGEHPSDAVAIVLGEGRRKVRAPTMAELDQLSQQRAQGGQ